MLKKLFLSLLAIFGFCFLIPSDTYADSDDIIYEVTSSNYQTTPYYLCSNVSSQSSTRCNDYKYLTISSTCSSDYAGNYFQFGYATSGFNEFIEYKFNIFPSLSYNFVSLNRFYYNSSVLANSQFPSSDCSIKAVLSKSASSVTPSGSLTISENGSFDVTNYATAIVTVPQTVSDLPPYSELVVDSFWKYHVAIAGGLASIFAIFVVYRIIKSRLR